MICAGSNPDLEPPTSDRTPEDYDANPLISSSTVIKATPPGGTPRLVPDSPAQAAHTSSHDVQDPEMQIVRHYDTTIAITSGSAIGWIQYLQTGFLPTVERMAFTVIAGTLTTLSVKCIVWAAPRIGASLVRQLKRLFPGRKAPSKGLKVIS